MYILRYIVMLMRHKRWVWHYGRKLGVGRWQLLKHDLSKLTPSELPYYAVWKSGGDWNTCLTALAINHHHKRNPHHWEYWVLQSEHFGMKDNTALDIPQRYILEMCADWLAAARAHDGKQPTSIAEWTWFQKNFWAMKISSLTRSRIYTVLGIFFKEKA
jgi:hypothetical protein